MTGVAPYSLGESVVSLLAQEKASLICLDIQPNVWLKERWPVEYLEINLNPLDHEGGLAGFSHELYGRLKECVVRLDTNGVSAVIQSAGTYWAGTLAESTDHIRSRVFGVNLLSHIEVLCAVMRINRDLGVNNTAALAHIEIGSFQGLNIRPARTLYAVSKAAGIDLAAALNHEVGRSIYVAPGPIDTPMLHSNHWVIKAGGAPGFINELKHRDRELYRSVFVDCSDEIFRQMSSWLKFPNASTHEFESYKKARNETANGEFGILSPDECAKVVVDLVRDANSGAYLVLRRHGGQMTVDYRSFEQLDRYAIF